MSSVGETLRRERLRSGLDLERIAQDTKISVRTLELIESDQFEKLPGAVFARSFVRQYARAIGVDAEEMVAELEKTFGPPTLPVSSVHEIPREPEILMPRVSRSGAGSRFGSGSAWTSLAMVVFVMLACSGAYTLWLKMKAPSPPVDTTPAGQTGTAAPIPPAETAPPAQEPATPSVSGTITTDNATGALHIALTAEEATWVRATANGKVVFSGVIQPNETKALSAGDTVTLRLGNAGGVAISLNGKAIPAVGPKGQVRTVQLSPDGAVQVAPTPKPQPVEEKTQSL